jgi:hypothetical protein
MSKASSPAPVKLIVAMIAARPALFDMARQALGEHFGEADYVSAALPFTHTTYYQAEFGVDLWRQFISLSTLINPGRLAAIKTLTNALEQSWAVENRRLVNLDPGYITGAKLVLATVKNNAHRIYLADGIYAELTLIYHGGNWNPLPWTYPDYRSEEYLQILREIRHLYLAQVGQGARKRARGAPTRR